MNNQILGVLTILFCCINDLLQKGYTVIINDNENLPENIASLKKIIHETLTANSGLP